MPQDASQRFVVVGGGIAGVVCAQELCALRPDAGVTLVSDTTRLKGVSNVRRLSSNIEEFEVVELDLNAQPLPNLRTLQASAAGLQPVARRLLLADGTSLPYDRLCICTGATPKVVADHQLVLVLRDQDTVAALAERLATAKRIVLVGNGGIALELAHSLRGVEVVWVLKQGHIGDAFFDTDAAAFLKTELEQQCGSSGGGGSAVPPVGERQHGPPAKPPTHIAMHRGAGAGFGHAVGPQWAAALPLGSSSGGSLTLEANCGVAAVEDAAGAEAGDWPLTVRLTNGKLYGADCVVSAIGVTPNTGWLRNALPLAPGDGGILVDGRMESRVPGVFAAGDACCLQSPEPEGHWFQMRLWTQAKVMGAHAAHCMAAAEARASVGLQLELFAHVTRFLGKKVVLLGRYNGQGLPAADADGLVSYSRATEGPYSTFVRVLLLRGRMVGAVLIGETELEEAFENLILDGLDLSSYGPGLLDPDVEIGHIFD